MTRIAQHIHDGNWEALTLALSQMTNSEFRRNESVVRKTLSDVDSDLFWQAYLHLLQYRHQAFLTCILSIRRSAGKEAVSFSSDAAKETAAWIHANIPESAVKIARMALPLIGDETRAEAMLSLLCEDRWGEWCDVLAKEDSALAYYLLFKALRHADNHQLAHRMCLTLIGRGSDMAFNMANIIKVYFGLDDIRSNFAIHIEPYELNYLETSFDNFSHFLQGKRPKI